MRISETTTDKSKIGFKDAFHVPGIAVTCNKSIKPGAFVVFTNQEMTEVAESGSGETLFHGVVDSFVDHEIMPGEVFYVIVHPSMSNNLRHDFTINTNLVTPKRVWTAKDEEDDEYLNDSCRGCYN